MASITFDRFDLGIDHRKGAAVSDANRLREMKNAYVTTGMATAKRQGLKQVATLAAGTRGLFAAFGKLHTFSSGTAAHNDALFVNHAVPLSSNAAAAVRDVHFADVFNGFVYAAIEYDGGVVQHHYLDGAAQTHIADNKCPHTKACIKMASKIFAVGSGDADVVRYCSTSKPRDWSTENDAGFLPTGLNMRGDRSANALGAYQNKLVVFSRDGSQVWAVDPDPTAMKLADVVENVGTQHPRTVATVGGDLYFMSDYGFKSITTLADTENLADVDIGSPIDALVRKETASSIRPKAFYFYGTGQYLCAIGNQIFVYSVSRSSKIAAWSRYFLPREVDAFAELNMKLYMRCGDDVFVLDEESTTDAGLQFEVLIDLPYMDFKSRGKLKHIYAVDVVSEGACQFSIGFDQRDADAFTPPFVVEGNSQPGDMLPVDCIGTEFSLRFRNYDASPFRLDSVTVYYNTMEG